MNCLRCPLCHELLVENIQGLACANSHQFDRAREGYFHLLPVQYKGSREPGDGKLQLQARRYFLRAEFFAPLKYKLQSLLPKNVSQVLDIGCGEGYFTAAFADALPNADIYGLDISKAGIKLAAKSVNKETINKKLFYTVASCVDLPFVDASMDVITRIYAPSKDEELQRVLKPNGLLIIVTPGEHHLLALRQRIYAEIRPHPAPEAPKGFTVVACYEVQSELHLSAGEYAEALLTMTPFAWRMTSPLREQIIAEGLVDRLHFNVSVYQRLTQSNV